jgi:predicted CXXCH cytochrome family protein
MIVAKQDVLCFQCHTELQQGMGTGKSKHAPVMTGECTQCHSPHKSKMSKLILAESPDLCFTCHKNLKARMGTETTHPPAVRDCLRCHLPHFSKDPSLMAQPVPALCGDCHDLNGSSFAKAHISIKAAVMDCKSCHDPHASKDPKLFKVNIHPPFAARSCDDCHIGEKR